MIHQPIEVSEDHYHIIRVVLAGYVFHRIHEGKFFVKADSVNSAKELDYIMKHLNRKKWAGFI